MFAKLTIATTLKSTQMRYNLKLTISIICFTKFSYLFIFLCVVKGVVFRRNAVFDFHIHGEC